MVGVLGVARDELGGGERAMLHRYFGMVEANLGKYVRDYEGILGEFREVLAGLGVNTPTDVLIYIADMLKQLLLKLLKTA